MILTAGFRTVLVLWVVKAGSAQDEEFIKKLRFDYEKIESEVHSYEDGKGKQIIGELKCNDGVDVEVLRSHFRNALSHQRHQSNLPLKQASRKYILEKFAQYGLETAIQTFTKNKTNPPGENLIGAFGLNNGSKLVIVGAHYDTVRACPGVSDNGGGVVALLEVARIFGSNCRPHRHAMIVVAFDYEEAGLEGSKAFVAGYLRPLEQQRNLTVEAVINLDMVLSYNSSNNSNILDPIFGEINPTALAEHRANGNKGNFISAWSRLNHEDHLVKTFEAEFENMKKNLDVKFYSFAPDLPRPTGQINRTIVIFYSSDHAAFWFPPVANVTYPALMLIDTGPLRGYQQICYHKPCDDTSQLTSTNLEFLRTVVLLVRNSVTRLTQVKPIEVQTSQLWLYGFIFIAIFTVLTVGTLLTVWCFSYQKANTNQVERNQA